MDVSLDLYKIFCAVVKTGNMSAAAKELFISQPAVSMSIRQLEDRAGAPLFVRTAKGVRPTPEGRVLYEYLDRALGLIKTAEKKYSEMVNLELGEIRISASDTVIANFLLPYIDKFLEKYGNINLKVTNKTTFESLKLLRSGRVDMCFVNMPIPPERDLEIFELIKIHDCLIGGAKYKDLAETGIKLKDMSSYPLLLLENLSNSRRLLDKYAQDNGVILQPMIELGSNDLLLEFARINMGLTYVIREFSQSRIDGETVFEIPVDPPAPERAIGMVKLKNVALSHAASAFAGLFDLEV
ncbi:MAG: LysR family transcriptional regulator [Firmicutes bacterium]|nr:LysR family transcriptional regulator [Bacillota bacterium]